MSMMSARHPGHRVRVNCLSHVTLRHLLTHLGVYIIALCSSFNTTTFCFLHVCSVLTPTYEYEYEYEYDSTCSSES
jgi:hypothetical protein